MLDVLRVEAGVPRAPNELGEKVLPPELGPLWMERAVSAVKGCYTGQEIVARLVSRGAESHRLVSLRFAGEPAPPGSEIRAQGKAVGEVTSSARSTLGAIGLGFVRRPADAVGSELESAGRAAQVIDAPVASRA
jgi:folate-binding protein YgfZ